jgi:menaquinone-dependent protoporphyrinogen oxidase
MIIMGGVNMMKGLVVYGTRYGTAKEIAEEISRTLKDENVDVNLLNAKEIRDHDVLAYDLIVVGSGIKMGKWTKESINFLKKNRDILSNKKIALFVSCGAANKEKSKANGQERYLDNISRDYLTHKPIATGLFGSVYDPNANNGLMFKFINRFIRKELEKEGKDPTQRIDYRNWDEIRTWSKNLIK